MTDKIPFTDDPDDMSGLVPDRIPRWLEEMVRRSKGRDLDRFSLLDEHYKHTDVVRSDKYDHNHFISMREKAEELEDLAISRFVDDPSFYDLIQDEYLGLYKSDPRKRKPTDMKPTHRLNHATLSKAMEMRDWSDLRTYTELDQWASAMAAVEFGLKLAEIFDELKELQGLQNKMNDQDRQVAQLLKELEDIGPEGEMEQAEGLLDQLDELINGDGGYGETIGELTEAIKGSGNEIRQAVKEALGEAAESGRQVQDALESFGTDPGALRRMPHEARMELARRIARNRKLRELADKIGRFVTLALGEQARKIVHGTDEIHDIELGDNLNRLLASELMMLAHPKLKLLFLKNFAEKELKQYQLRGTERVGRGAIICMIDSSGSMSGSKETWAKAVAIALLNIAAKQNRDFYGLIFSSRHELMEFHFPKGMASPTEVIDFAEFEYMGGTDFERPIGRAVEILQEQFNDEGSQKGDLVMITDGWCAVGDEWLDRYLNAKKDLAFRHYGCLIGTDPGPLEVLCDINYNILELAKGDDIKEIFGYV